MAEPLVIGVGNRLRGDDGAGPSVASLLAARGLDADRCDEPIDVVELMRGRDHVIVVDAVSGELPGRVWHVEATERKLPLALSENTSTHLVGLADALELARALRIMPARLEVIAIEGSRFELGAEQSIAVERAAARVAAAIAADLGAATASG